MNVLKKRFFLGILTVCVLIGIGVGVWQILEARKRAAAQAEAAGVYQTTDVRRGDLALSITGSGTVIATQTVELSFSVEGKVAELNVEVGDTVTRGQALASLADDDRLELEQEILERELAVKTAQKALDDLKSGGEANLAQALADLATAEEAYSEAKINLHQKGDPRCAKSKTESYYIEYLYAQGRVDEWEGYLNDGNTGYGHTYILQRLEPMRKDRNEAYINWKYCEGYTDQEIAQSEADLQVAEAELEQAKADYEELLSNGGVDPEQVTLAEATLENAQQQRASAQRDLEGLTIFAPIDGTVMGVNGSVGDEVETNTFITISDLSNPRVKLNIDEVDLPNFGVGCSAQVAFDSLPGQTFSGVVSEMSPSLVSVNSVGVVQAVVDLESSKTISGKTLPLNLTANVEVVCKEVEDSLVVSALGLRETDDRSTYVYVLDEQGQPEKRDVAVGLQTVASVEILSGLEEGDKVIISAVEE